MKAVVLAGALAALAACGGEDDRPASFSYIHAAILQPNCTTSSCHTDLNAQAGVKLDDPDAAYVILVGQVCDPEAAPAEDQRNYVLPGDPARSRLVRLLRGDEVRRAMPPDRPLPAPDIDLIERWIRDGALCN